jgi:hypothetical protein
MTGTRAATRCTVTGALQPGDQGARQVYAETGYANAIQLAARWIIIHANITCFITDPITFSQSQARQNPFHAFCKGLFLTKSPRRRT